MAGLFSGRDGGNRDIESAVSKPEISQAEPQDPGLYSQSLVEAIRKASATHRLSSLSELGAAFPPPEGKSPAAAIEEAQNSEDIKKINTASETWYFSERTMTGAYALHLARLEERDPARLVAETVRDDSRIYPRPTDLRVFEDPPFSMTKAQTMEIIGMMELRPDMSDIHSSAASNGALYLHSSLYLSDTLAAALTEWIEVGQKENP